MSTANAGATGIEGVSFSSGRLMLLTGNVWNSLFSKWLGLAPGTSFLSAALSCPLGAAESSSAQAGNVLVLAVPQYLLQSLSPVFLLVF